MCEKNFNNIKFFICLKCDFIVSKLKVKNIENFKTKNICKKCKLFYYIFFFKNTDLYMPIKVINKNNIYSNIKKNHYKFIFFYKHRFFFFVKHVSELSIFVEIFFIDVIKNELIIKWLNGKEFFLNEFFLLCRI